MGMAGLRDWLVVVQLLSYAGRCYQTLTKVAQTLVNGTYYDTPVACGNAMTYEPEKYIGNRQVLPKYPQ